MSDKISNDVWFSHPMNPAVQLRRNGLTAIVRYEVWIEPGMYYSTPPLYAIFSHKVFDHNDRWVLQDISQMITEKSIKQTFYFKKRLYE